VDRDRPGQTNDAHHPGEAPQAFWCGAHEGEARTHPLQGYRAEWFTDVFAAYCPEPEQPEQTEQAEETIINNDNEANSPNIEN